MTLNIKLIGKEAERYFDVFDGYNCKIVEHYDDINEHDDIVFCLSYNKIIPEYKLKLPRFGVYVNHSTDLPMGRGWAPIQWSVLKGLNSITVTLFKAVSECDAGPWVYKDTFRIEPHDTIYSLLEKDYVTSKNLILKLLKCISINKLVFHEQAGNVSYWPPRRPEDSCLDTNKTLNELWNNIRICDNENYPAFFMINGHKVIIRYEVLP